MHGHIWILGNQLYDTFLCGFWLFTCVICVGHVHQRCLNYFYLWRFQTNVKKAKIRDRLCYFKCFVPRLRFLKLKLHKTTWMLLCIKEHIGGIFHPCFVIIDHRSPQNYHMPCFVRKIITTIWGSVQLRIARGSIISYNCTCNSNSRNTC